MEEIKTKVLIIGSGPAGCTAAIYAARANLEPILLHGEQAGGQLTITTDVENYPGFADIIQGPWLMEQMHKQVEKVGTKVIFDHIKMVNLKNYPFKAISSLKKIYCVETLIICTGSQAKWLQIASEEKFRGFGVSSCATCDGFFYKGKEVAVVGGGNTAVEEALYLANHASKVTLIHRRNSLRAEKILQDRLFKNKKINIIWDNIIDEILGKDNPKTVTGVRINNIKTNITTSLNVDGVFIAIGHQPNTSLFKGQIEMDKFGYILTKTNSTQTNINGVFAAGDVQDSIYRQAITAAGSGCMAALEAEKFLNTKNLV